MDMSDKEPTIPEARTPEELLQFNILNARERVIIAKKQYRKRTRYYKHPPIIDFQAETEAYFMYCRGAFDEKHPDEAAKIEELLQKSDFTSIDTAFRLVDNWFRYIGLVKIDNKLRFHTAMERNKSMFG